MWLQSTSVYIILRQSTSCRDSIDFCHIPEERIHQTRSLAKWSQWSCTKDCHLDHCGDPLNLSWWPQWWSTRSCLMITVVIGYRLSWLSQWWYSKSHTDNHSGDPPRIFFVITVVSCTGCGDDRSGDPLKAVVVIHSRRSGPCVPLCVRNSTTLALPSSSRGLTCPSGISFCVQPALLICFGLVTSHV